MIARLYRIKEIENIEHKPSLSIDGKGIRFLRDVLIETSDFRQNNHSKDNHKEWILTFFKDNPQFRQQIKVEFYDEDDQLETNQDWYDFSENKRWDYRKYDDLC